MKRAGAILILTLLITAVFSVSAFAAEDFKVEKTTPRNGDEGMAMENMGVKVTFSVPVYNEENEKFNSALCTITDEDGNAVDTIAIFNKKRPEEMLVLVVTDATDPKKNPIKGNTKYTMTIQKGFLSAEGTELPQQFSVSFTTLNPQNTTRVSVLMMIAMMVAMVVAMRKGQKGGDEEDQKEKLRREANEKFNPYKVAKETGRPVEEVIAEEQKRKEKIEAKLRRKEEKEAREKAKIDKYRKEKKIDIASGDNLRVPGPRPISEYSDYKAPLDPEE